jgi:hypothetical protein
LTAAQRPLLALRLAMTEATAFEEAAVPALALEEPVPA